MILHVKQLDLDRREPVNVLFDHLFEFLKVLRLLFEASFELFADYISCEVVFNLVSDKFLLLTAPRLNLF